MNKINKYMNNRIILITVEIKLSRNRAFGAHRSACFALFTLEEKSLVVEVLQVPDFYVRGKVQMSYVAL